MMKTRTNMRRTSALRRGLLPLPWTRLVLSSLALVMSIVAGALAVQLFIKGRKQKHYAKSHAPTGVAVSINTDDITHLGIGVFIASSLLNSASSNPLLFLLQDMFHVLPLTLVLPWGLRLPTKLISTTKLRMQAYMMLVATLAVIATTIPYTLVARHRGARITFTQGGVELPEADAAQLGPALGFPREYWQTNFVRVVALTAWVSVIFAVPLTVASFVALVRGGPAEPNADVVQSAEAGSTQVSVLGESVEKV